MRAFHLILFDRLSAKPRRVDFEAEGPDHAFQIARNETDGVEVELWEGRVLLACLTKSGDNLWKFNRPEEPDDNSLVAAEMPQQYSCGPERPISSAPALPSSRRFRPPAMR